MKKQISIIFLSAVMLVIAVGLVSCNGKTDASQLTAKMDSVDITPYGVSISDSMILLQSYYLSTSYADEGKDVVIGYNYKEHSLDLFSDSTAVGKILLERHGVNAVQGRPVALTALSKDSIWIYDGVAFCLIDGNGKMLRKHKDDRLVFLDTNYAMQTACMGWHNGDMLLYPIDKDGKFYVEYYSVSKGEIVKEVELDFPECNENGSKSYADMKYPNVTYANNLIIYNYPYSSSVMTIDMDTEKRSVYNVGSEYADDKLSPYKEAKSMQEWLHYDWANTHFYEVMYLPGLEMYVRPMLGGVDIKDYKDESTVVDARKLYLAFMDKQFKLLGEVCLKEKTYNNFHGWCPLKGSIAIFQDNLLGKQHENLEYDKMKPKP